MSWESFQFIIKLGPRKVKMMEMKARMLQTDGGSVQPQEPGAQWQGIKEAK